MPSRADIPSTVAAAQDPRSSGPRVMRADLHVHSYHSGYAAHLRVFKTRDCYSDPEDVYRVAKARGMDLVCLTDHDTIDGCLEFLSRHPDAPDFIVGEEIECRLPARTRGDLRVPVRVHLGALGMTERIHRDVQPLRDNVFEAAAYLEQEGVFFALNHLFFFYSGDRWRPYAEALLRVCRAVETRNGAMSEEQNDLIDRIAGAHPEPLTCVGGSDAHVLAYVGRTWTAAPATTREEFLAALREGRAAPGGEHGGARRMTAEIYSVIGSYWLGLAGRARHDLTPLDRAVGGALSIASLPGQFVPALVAVAQKARERSCMRRIARELDRGAGRLDWDPALGARTGLKPEATEIP
jgi:predicted metal-dependent phosphoesterase TrpH